MSFILAEHPFFALTGALYAASMALYTAAWRSTREIIGRAATGVMAAALLVNVALVGGRWAQAGRAPFKSLFETGVFLALCMAAVYLAMEWMYKTRVFGALAALFSAGSIVFALTKWDAEIVRLPPALQSAWFVPHVVIYFVGYAACGFATIVSLVQLFRPELELKAGTVLRGTPISLEQVSYYSIRFGFTLLSMGLLMGSMWAKSAWGDYWVWDPKENWSLVTWLVYAGYLHLRRLKGWRGRANAWLVIGGFAIVMFTYLGMGLLPTAQESAHVYTDQG